MIEFAGRIAVVTGGGTGMGRELVRQLTAEGCTVAMCDVSAVTMAETKRLAEAAGLPQGTRITAHIADVGVEDDLIRFQREVAEQLDTDRIHFLFNNAGIGGGGSFVTGPRDEWERTFNICWNGVYHSCRAFLPMLLKADRAHITNTSSVNGFWASLGPNVSHTAYAAAKFAVKGFTEALITDLRLNAPHVTCSVVMPGHIGTSIASNTRQVLAGDRPLNEHELKQARRRIASLGLDPSKVSDEDIAKLMADNARRFLEDAPMTAAAAAKVILDGVRAERWRILVGDDAHALDAAVRANPEQAYEPDFQHPFTLAASPPVRK
ncbi:Putative oxidoreductase SadH [Alphaproteobacteria bacterium SO-S41]|nr:Putative oxidoreductase SadH [Alphaproteobacteria bacterium SO-S41]